MLLKKAWFRHRSMKVGGMDLQRCYLLCGMMITLSVSAAAGEISFTLCNDASGNYTQNSTYQNNLNALLSPLSSNVNEYGFYNASAGQSPDKTSVVAMCRGDVELNECRECLNDAVEMTVQMCPTQKEAFGGYYKCTIRYSNNPIIGSISNSNNPVEYIWNPGNNVTSMEQFNQDLWKFLDGLVNQAANNGSSFLKFASGKTTGPDSQPIYALVQCIPDLSAQECSACLNSSFEEMRKNCDNCSGKTGAALIGVCCTFRYDNALFFDTSIHVPPVSSPPPPPQLGKKEDDHHKTPTLLLVVVVVVVTVVVMVIIIVCIVLIKRLKRRPENDGITVGEEANPDNEIGVVETPMKFGLITLQNATKNFSEANKIGEGGFGVVYKGTLENGELVAVKRLSENSRQGNLEFKNEVDLIAKLQHKNLVRLLGYCQEGREMILVYEFVSHGSLDDNLFRNISQTSLSLWFSNFLKSKFHFWSSDYSTSINFNT